MCVMLISYLSMKRVFIMCTAQSSVLCWCKRSERAKRASSLLGRAEASPTQVLRMEIFSVYIFAYISRTFFLFWSATSRFRLSSLPLSLRMVYHVQVHEPYPYCVYVIITNIERSYTCSFMAIIPNYKCNYVPTFNVRCFMLL